MQRRSHGFTLVEVAIVLVVIGLIAGSIVAGRDMIRNSEVQSVIADAERYKQATETFKQKYNGLPGDIINAEALWGSDSGCPTTTYTTTAHAATCNGNGDGHVGYSDGIGVYFPTEAYRYWQQLADAGLIEGSYNGITGPLSIYNSVLGINTPKSKMSAGGYYFNFHFYPSGTTQAWPYIAHDLMFGSLQPPNHTNGPILTAIEAQGIDQKMDDGLPGTGNVVTFKHSYSNCSTSDDATLSVYNVTVAGPLCALHFLMNF